MLEITKEGWLRVYYDKNHGTRILDANENDNLHIKNNKEVIVKYCTGDYINGKPTKQLPKVVEWLLNSTGVGPVLYNERVQRVEFVGWNTYYRKYEILKTVEGTLNCFLE